MKIAGITLERPARTQTIQLAAYAAAGFFAAACCLDGRAPLAAGLLAACRPGGTALAALAGSAAGAFVFLPFGPALRCCGILVLVCAVLSAFRETKWFRHALFRPLTAAGSALAVELAYTLQMGLTGQGLTRMAACTVLSGILCHYCALVLRETSIPRRQTQRLESDGIRRRLRLSAQALRSLCESFSVPAPKKEENPAVIFDRAAEVVCRGCALRDVCWNKEYVSTFNAFNDATPALLDRGRAEPGDFAVHFSSRCIHFPQLLSAINTEVTALLLRRQYRRQLERERERTRGQYAQLGELVAQAMAAPEAPPATGREMLHDVALASAPKEGQRVSGDSLTWFRTAGKLYLLLSDGMDPDPALRTLNAALNLRSDDQGSFTTIDLLAVDLTDGQGALYKYGAAPTYLKRQGSVRRLTGSALPAGLQDVSDAPTPSRFPLEENTFVLMISDGVADAGDDQWLQDLLAGWQGEDPNMLASLVLREAGTRRHGEDDCSVICLYLPKGDSGAAEV